MKCQTFQAVFICLPFLALFCPTSLFSQTPFFSGPQVGEKTTPFKVVRLTGSNAGTEMDLIEDNHGAPTAFVFLHGIERSMAPLIRVIDEYGAMRSGALRTEFVFLSNDRLAAEQRFPLVAKSLRLQSRVTLSVDGIEGPGNYGLNKECLMTVILARQNQVTANFALVQPGLADAPKIIQAMASVSGDPNPPAADVLEAQRQRVSERGPGRQSEPREMAGTDPRRTAADWAALASNLQTEADLREAVRALIAEVQSLRQEVSNLRANRPGEGPPTAAAKKEPFPGAPPSDPKLLGLLRQFIQPTNEDAVVDKVLADVEEYIKGDQGLTRQAVDGWTRVLHFGDRYGTAYARKAGQAFLDRIQR